MDEMASSGPTVFVVDDEPDARDSVAALSLSLGLDCQVYASAEAFLREYPRGAPGCVVTDIRMLGMNGLELIRALPEHNITLPVIAISGYADTKLAVEIMRHGAVTMLEKPCRREELVEAIRGAIAQDAQQRAAREEQADFVAKLKALSASERAVLDGMMAGKPNKAIARELDVSIRTIESRRAQVFSKLGCQTVAEIVRKATRAGYEMAGQPSSTISSSPSKGES